MTDYRYGYGYATGANAWPLWTVTYPVPARRRGAWPWRCKLREPRDKEPAIPVPV